MNSSASLPVARSFSFRRHGRTGKKSHMISALNLRANIPSFSARGLRACHLRNTKVSPENISRPKLGVHTQAGASKFINFEDGTCVRYVGSREETEFLYQEVFVEQQYLQHGVTIGRGDTVLDIGANIGLFTLFAAQRCPAGLVLAFEPIPFIFEALHQNCAALSDQLPSAGKAKVKCFNAGIGDGRSNEAECTYYQNAAGWSTFRPDESEVRRAMGVYLDSLLSSPAPLSPLLAVMKRMPSWLFKAAGRAFVDRKLAGKVQVTCKLLSISEVLEQEEIESVDLLKVDVERAEKEVLEGILPSDWPKIRQVAMEVHDVDGGLQTVVNLLESRGGFENVVVSQSDLLKGSTLYCVYATRS